MNGVATSLVSWLQRRAAAPAVAYQDSPRPVMADYAPTGSDERTSAAEQILKGDAELIDALDNMTTFVEKAEPSGAPASDAGDGGRTESPFKLLKQNIRMQKITESVFQAVKHTYESEGSDAVLFFEVPKWVSFDKIRGSRYRQITAIMDDDDDISHVRDGITVFGYPGASGWADKIGDVAVHYMHATWMIFSKIFPFEDQKAALAQHEDCLLLGSTRHVMLTPSCVHTISGADRRARVRLLDSEGSLVSKTATCETLSSAARFRLYTTWGHKDSPFSDQVEQHQCSLQQMIDEPETLGHRARRLFASLVGGRIKVSEQWMRYPGAPLDPSYFTQLLAMATSMSPEEERARELLEPAPSHRASAAQGDAEANIMAPVTMKAGKGTQQSAISTVSV